MLMEKLTEWSTENNCGDMPAMQVSDSGNISVIFEAGPDDWVYRDWYDSHDRPFNIDIENGYSVVFCNNPDWNSQDSKPKTKTTTKPTTKPTTKKTTTTKPTTKKTTEDLEHEM